MSRNSIAWGSEWTRWAVAALGVCAAYYFSARLALFIALAYLIVSIPLVLLTTLLKARQTDREALRECEDRYRALIDAFPSLVFMMKEGRFTFANPAGARALGFADPAEIIGRAVLESIDPSLHDTVIRRMKRLNNGIDNPPVELILRRRDGSIVTVETTSIPIRIKGETFSLIIGHDISDRKRAEEERRQLERRILQAQKWESLSVTSGGVAHHFNNILQTIMGNAELALEIMPPLGQARDCVGAIAQEARRAAQLSTQMLATSGHAFLRLVCVDLDALVQRMIPVLDPTIGKGVRVEYRPVEGLPPVRIDVVQVQQLLSNLVTNAWESMQAEGGVVTIRAGVMHCDRAYLTEPYLEESLPEGAYVYVEVGDTGCGMDGDTQIRIFDPFFSTKFTGRGLGLPVALGIVRGLKGAIKIDSAPGRGTNVRVLFPALDAPVAREAAERDGETEWRGSGTILLVDDDPAVLEVTRRMLEHAGFRVVTAHEGRLALERFRAHMHEIVCVLLDLVMPGMDGAETLQQIRRLKAGVPVILSTGIHEEDLASKFPISDVAGVIQKPYHVSDLLAKLRQVLPK